MSKIKAHILQSKSSITFLPTIALLFCIVFADTTPTSNNFSLYFIIPILFIYFLPSHHKLIITYKPILYFFLLFLWSSLTIIASINMNNSLAELNAILGSFMFSFILVCFSIKQYKYILLFYALYILKFIFICYNAIKLESLEKTIRFGTEAYNANMFGYFGFFAIVSSFFLWNHLPKVLKLNKIKKFILFLVFLLIILLSLVFTFYSASRAGLSISVITSILLIFSYFAYPFSIKHALQLVFVLFIILTFIPIKQQFKFFENSTIQNRLINTNIKEDKRMDLLKSSKISMKNIIFGVGPGNFKVSSQSKNFSHNTFLELLVNNGIIGLFLFLAILKNYFTQSMKLYRINKHSRKEAQYFLIFLVMFITYNFFYVFHASMFLISFLFIIAIHQTQLINFYYKQNQKENNTY
jgi:hypothetical protein